MTAAATTVVDTKDVFKDTFDLYPGGSSFTGFLKVGQTLEEVIAADNKTLKELNVTHTQIADAMDTVVAYDRRMRELEPHSLMGGTKYGSVFFSSNGYFGSQGCPFVGCGAGASHDYTYTDVKTKESVVCSELAAHLIRTHQFFEGDVKYRVDPATIVRVLGIKPGVSYTPNKYVSEVRFEPDRNTHQSLRPDQVRWLRSVALEEWSLTRTKIGLLLPGVLSMYRIPTDTKACTGDFWERYSDPYTKYRQRAFYEDVYKKTGKWISEDGKSSVGLVMIDKEGSAYVEKEDLFYDVRIGEFRMRGLCGNGTFFTLKKRYVVPLDGYLEASYDALAIVAVKMKAPAPQVLNRKTRRRLLFGDPRVNAILSTPCRNTTLKSTQLLNKQMHENLFKLRQFKESGKQIRDDIGSSLRAEPPVASGVDIKTAPDVGVDSSCGGGGGGRLVTSSFRSGSTNKARGLAFAMEDGFFTSESDKEKNLIAYHQSLQQLAVAQIQVNFEWMLKASIVPTRATKDD